VRLIVMSMLTIALALGVSGKCIRPNRAIANLVAFDIKDDEALRSPEMV
jgi:hypothetical protein